MYKALALQLTCQTVNTCSTRDEAETRMLTSLGRIEQQLEAAINAVGRDTLLVTVPEHFLTGAPVTETLDEWR